MFSYQYEVKLISSEAHFYSTQCSFMIFSNRYLHMKTFYEHLTTVFEPKAFWFPFVFHFRSKFYFVIE